MKATTRFYTLLLLLTYSYTYGQVDIDKYDYKREIKNISEQWYSIFLPADIFSKLSTDFSDIRIFGITETNDSIEAPYLLRLSTEKRMEKQVTSKVLNTAHNALGYYFTLETPTKENINKIKLEFKQQNFDWNLKLQGSHNQYEWFTIVEEYRILSIKNDLTSFQFTDLAFPISNYRFYRVTVNSNEKPNLISAKISNREIIPATLNDFPIKKIGYTDGKKNKQTKIDIELESLVPISCLKINVKETIDYLRQTTISYLADSIKTEKGWINNYLPLATGFINSLEDNEFEFKSTNLQKIRVVIHNRDNKPLNIESFEVKGFVHELAVRFSEPANYFLAYGNSNAKKAQYDIDQFADKIPKNLPVVKLGIEQISDKKRIGETTPLFMNKNWLWLVMTILIAMLGWFSISMMKKKE